MIFNQYLMTTVNDTSNLQYQTLYKALFILFLILSSQISHVVGSMSPFPEPETVVNELPENTQLIIQSWCLKH